MTTTMIAELERIDSLVDGTLADLDADLGRNGDTSAGKALALLEAFSGPLAVLGVTALAARAEVPKSTAHRLLSVLVAHGYVRRVGDRYCLTEQMFEMGNQIRACRTNGLREVAVPYLSELFAQTRQTVHLATLVGTDVLYLNKLYGHDAPKCPTLVGGKKPAYGTALGKALLAFGDPGAVEANLKVQFRRFTPYTILTAAQLRRCLERVKSEGVATDHEESLRGVNCIAAPIRDARSGAAIGAISICSISSSIDQRYRRTLLKATEELSRHHISEG